MSFIRSQAIFLLAAIATTLTLAGCVTNQHVYLTWQGDTGTTMTVTYQSKAAPADLTIYWDDEPHHGELSAYAHWIEADSWIVPLKNDVRHVVSAKLTNLVPGETYYFSLGGRPGVGERKFRTIATDHSPIRFVAGGDMGPFPRTRRLLRVAARQDPDFAVIGGDIAYANGDPKSAWRWDRWIQSYGKEMVTSDGCMIPMVLAIGNHEVNDLQGDAAVRAPFYFGYFPQGGTSYFRRDFGADLMLLVLDTGHVVPHADQVPWLEENLRAGQDTPLKIATYHVPQYPSHRSFDDTRSREAREQWGPLFDKYGLSIAFEHHDHAFKRTHPLRHGEIDPAGTVYLGDGCMGVPARKVENADAWYIVKASGTPHFWLVDILDGTATYQAVNRKGEVFDTYPETD